MFMSWKGLKYLKTQLFKANKMGDDSYFSNELHEILLEKNMASFWKTWNVKLVKPKYFAVIDGELMIKLAYCTHICWSF